MNNDYCPLTPSSRHLFAGQYATVMTKTEFEPVSYGEAANETLYRRIDWVITTCQCGYSRKAKPIKDNES